MTSTAPPLPPPYGLLRPGPPPRGWLLSTAALVAAVVIFDLALAWVSVAVYDNPREMFEENAPATYASVALLCWCAALAWSVRNAYAAGGDPLASLFTWTAVGFALAALDDAVRIHEFIENLVAKVPRVGATAAAGWVDETLVALYGLVLLGQGWRWRRRILGMCWMLYAGLLGSAAFAAMVWADVTDAAYWIEEGLKLTAETWFASALLAARLHPRTPALRQSAAADSDDGTGRERNSG